MKLFLSTLFFLTALSAFAETGTDRGNPGDEYSKAFASLGYDLAQDLAKDPLPGVDASALLAAVRKTQLHSEASLELRGFPVDAINYPDPVNPSIVVSRAGWDRMGTEPHRRAFLVLHEYLSIMGVDDSKYEVSSLLDRANVCSRTPAFRAAIERQLKKSCYRVIEDDLQYVVSVYISDPSITQLKASDVRGLVGLENIYFSGMPAISIEPDFFRGFPRMDSFIADSPFQSLGDCSFLASMPLIRDASFNTPGAGSNSYEGVKFRSLESVAPRCFAPLHSLRSLSIGVDGKKVAPGFLGDLAPSVTMLRIQGINLDSIPVSELKLPLSGSLNMDAFDHDFPAAYLAALKARFNGPHVTCGVTRFPHGLDGHDFYSLYCTQ